MDSVLRMRYRWVIVAVLAAPALGLFGYSLVRPGVRGKDDRIFPGAAQAKAAATSSANSAGSASSPWVMQESGTTAGLRGIYSVDGKVAWASGTEGTVLRTLDGGEHWAKCAVPDGVTDGSTLDFRGVQAWDANTAIVMASGPGDKSRLYTTTDGCKSWVLAFRNPDAPGGFFDSFRIDWKSITDAHPSGYGLLLGDPVDGHFRLFEVQNLGQSIKKIKSDALALPAADAAAFAASNSNLAGYFKDAYGFISGGKSGSFLVRVPYGQGAWKKLPDGPEVPTVSLPLASGNESSGAFSIAQARLDGAHTFTVWMVAVGGDYARPNENTGTAASSIDGGLHWSAATKPPHGYRSSVAWSHDLMAWIAVGTNGSDISHGNGQSWQPLDDGNWNALSLPFVVGPKGRIARLNASAVK